MAEARRRRYIEVFHNKPLHVQERDIKRRNKKTIYAPTERMTIDAALTSRIDLEGVDTPGSRPGGGGGGGGQAVRAVKQQVGARDENAFLDPLLFQELAILKNLYTRYPNRFTPLQDYAAMADLQLSEAAYFRLLNTRNPDARQYARLRDLIQLSRLFVRLNRGFRREKVTPSIPTETVKPKPEEKEEEKKEEEKKEEKEEKKEKEEKEMEEKGPPRRRRDRPLDLEDALYFNMLELFEADPDFIYDNTPNVELTIFLTQTTRAEFPQYIDGSKNREELRLEMQRLLKLYYDIPDIPDMSALRAKLKQARTAFLADRATGERALKFLVDENIVEQRHVGNFLAMVQSVASMDKFLQKYDEVRNQAFETIANSLLYEGDGEYKFPDVPKHDPEGQELQFPNAPKHDPNVPKGGLGGDEKDEKDEEKEFIQSKVVPSGVMARLAENQQEADEADAILEETMRQLGMKTLTDMPNDMQNWLRRMVAMSESKNQPSIIAGAIILAYGATSYLTDEVVDQFIQRMGGLVAYKTVVAGALEVAAEIGMDISTNIFRKLINTASDPANWKAAGNVAMGMLKLGWWGLKKAGWLANKAFSGLLEGTKMLYDTIASIQKSVMDAIRGDEASYPEAIAQLRGNYIDSEFRENLTDWEVNLHDHIKALGMPDEYIANAIELTRDIAQRRGIAEDNIANNIANYHWSLAAGRRSEAQGEAYLAKLLQYRNGERNSLPSRVAVSEFDLWDKNVIRKVTEKLDDPEIEEPEIEEEIE